VDIQEYIESGVLEAFVLGSASEAETRELLYYKEKYPQVQIALQELEIDLENIAEHMAITPPPGTWSKIEASINDLPTIPEYDPLRFKRAEGNNSYNFKKAEREYIEVAEADSTHMTIHKNWKWVFTAVFVLGKIFLACAIYFYLENRQAQQQIQELKTELRQNHLR
jgi:hypothetical protein